MADMINTTIQAGDNSVYNTSTACKLVRKKNNKKYNKREALMGYLFASPWLIGFLALMAFPIIYSFYIAMTNMTTQSMFVEFRGFQNFIAILTKDPDFYTSLGSTFWYVVMSVPMSLIYALFLAILLNAKTKGRKFYRALYYIPTLVTIVAVSLLWQRILSGNGLLNSFLGIFGIKGPDWLNNHMWATPALALMSTWSVGGTVVVFSAALTDVPSSLYEAADIDGATKVRKFFTITMPMLSPILFYNLLTATVAAFQIFAQPLLMTSGENNTMYMGYLIYKTAFQGAGAQGYASSMSWILMIIILAVTGVIRVLQRFFVFYND